MPFYTFHCEDCEATFDVRATIQDREAGLRPPCPKCASHEVQQVITAGLLLHSSGSDRRTAPACACGPNAGPGCCG
jgi:putative FmdB family regulatory protein